MNNAQLKYARERLAEARSTKLNNTPTFYSFSTETKDKLFAEGKFQVVKKKDSYVIEWEGEAEEKEKSVKRREEINNQYQKILDQLMLGDDEVALELINKFIGE